MSVCNFKAYLSWLKQTYSEPLDGAILDTLANVDRSNKELWKAMNFDEIHKDFLAGKVHPTNEQMMLATSVLCRQSLKGLELELAGKHIPILEHNIHNVMCSSSCLLGDKLRTLAMDISGCGCLDLSSKPGQDNFKVHGDWCAESSGQQLCEELGKCGEWKCSIADFHCERNEYNRIFVPLKGFGNQCSGAMKAIGCSLFPPTASLLCVMLIVLFF